MHVRDAVAQDARQLAAISVRAWRAGYKQIMPAEFLAALSVDEREGIWVRRLAGGMSTILVCAPEPGAALTGSLSCGRSADESERAVVAEIYALNVDPDHWGLGCGKALCGEAFARLAAAGFREVTLWVIRANERARRFYERLGFAPEPGSDSQFELAEFSIPDLRYRRSL